MRRLRGFPHQIEYFPTNEVINAATVNWNYKATSEVIKVDAWEIQEHAQKQYYRGTSGTQRCPSIRTNFFTFFV